MNQSHPKESCCVFHPVRRNISMHTSKIPSIPVPVVVVFFSICYSNDFFSLSLSVSCSGSLPHWISVIHPAEKNRISTLSLALSLSVTLGLTSRDYSDDPFLPSRPRPSSAFHPHFIRTHQKHTQSIYISFSTHFETSVLLLHGKTFRRPPHSVVNPAG